MKPVYEQYYSNATTKDLRFDIYGYSPPSKLDIGIDGGLVLQTGLEFRTVERYKEYKDAGFNVLLMQSSGKYQGEAWETSDCKLVMDRAHQAGIDKIIVLDERLMQLSNAGDGLVGEGKQFDNQQALESYVAECLSAYSAHPAFYGIQLKDEPEYTYFTAIGQVYRAIKKAKPEAFIQCNLLPYVGMGICNKAYPNMDDGGDMQARYVDYLEAFLDATGADYIMYDQYPFQTDKGYGTVFNQMYFCCLQIAASVCKKRGVELHFVLQAFSMYVNGEQSHRLPDEDETFYQMHAALGFGVKELSYFTYWTKSAMYLRGESFPDGGAMMTRKGEKTPMYGYVQKVNAMAQKLAPVLMNFAYVADRYVFTMPFRTHPFHLYHTHRGILKNVVKANVNQEVALINELYDKEREQYLYKIQNITYNYYEKQIGLPKQKITVAFAPEFSKIDVFDENEWKTVELKDGEYSVELAAGHAVYVLPY